MTNACGRREVIPLRGRGASQNPANRFDELTVERGEWTDPDDPAPRSQFLRDATRIILTRNKSPDLGFEVSLNPYRGCEHGCVYCLSGDTRVLMADGRTKPLGDIRVGDEIYGTVRRGSYRRYAKTTVLAHWSVEKPAYRVSLEDGTELVASGDHRFLTERGWKYVAGTRNGAGQRPHLTTTNKLMGTGAFAVSPRQDDDETPSLEWAKGLLAGLFDAEGSYSGGILRIPNTDPVIVEQAVRCLRRLGFACTVEGVARGRTKPIHVVRQLGGLRENLRFFHVTQPAILRRQDIEGQAVKSDARLRVLSIEPLGRSLPLFDITTGTRDFIANGVVSHNCYARPTHEYFGLSAGLDFETKIFVKQDAPELLRAELSSPRWTPQVIVMSGVTDPYQPVERRLRVTRRCLEVLAKFRNPVAVITKNHLVTRDIDVLSELARHHATAITLSITTLDRKLQRVMEPRTSVPERRLEAIAKLAEAGIPVGVNVAPVIPGLTDHEIPRILRAAAEAGATRAGCVMLRLPYAVAELFESWLDQHFPERKEKVLGRIRQVRGGRLNDPRFFSRMRGEGPYAEQVDRLFRVTCRRLGLNRRRVELSTAAFRRPGELKQLVLFD